MKKLIKKTFFVLGIALSTMTGLPAFGDTGSNNTAQQVNAGVSQAFGAATSNLLNALYVYLHDCQTMYLSWVNTLMQMSANQYGVTASQAVNQQAGKDTTAMVFALMTPPDTSKNAAAINAKVPYLHSPGLYASLIPVGRDEAAVVKAANVSSASLLSTVQYDPNQDQGKKALAFIQFAANMGDRILPLPPQVLKQANPIAADIYLNNLANYAAGQSAALNTLLKLYNERVPLTQLQGQSVLAADQASVLARLQPEWTSSVAKMTLVDVMRESLYTQAQTNYELFQMRMQLEQLNMLTAMMALQQQQTLGKSLVLQYQQKVVSSLPSSTQ